MPSSTGLSLNIRISPLGEVIPPEELKDPGPSSTEALPTGSPATSEVGFRAAPSEPRKTWVPKRDFLSYDEYCSKKAALEQLIEKFSKRLKELEPAYKRAREKLKLTTTDVKKAYYSEKSRFLWNDITRNKALIELSKIDITNLKKDFGISV